MKSLYQRIRDTGSDVGVQAQWILNETDKEIQDLKEYNARLLVVLEEVKASLHCLSVMK